MAKRKARRARNVRNIERRARQLADKHDNLEGSDGGEPFNRWAANRTIKLFDGEQGVFMPLANREGEPLVATVVGHQGERIWSPRRCTANLDGFHGKCGYCHQEKVEQRTGENTTNVRTVIFRVMLMWDFNYYVLRNRETRRGKQKQWTLWYSDRPDVSPPRGAQVGGLRHIILGNARFQDLQEFFGEMEDVCSCVAKTGDRTLSHCYVTQALCPECGCVVYDDDDLKDIGDASEIRNEVLGQPHACLYTDEGGCWNAKKDEEDHEGYYLEPVYACYNECSDPEPLDEHVWMRPVWAKRTGKRADTKWTWGTPPPSFWRKIGQAQHKEPLLNWLDYEVPEEIIKATEGLTPENAATKMRVDGLETQFKVMDVPFPFNDKCRRYGKKD